MVVGVASKCDDWNAPSWIKEERERERDREEKNKKGGMCVGRRVVLLPILITTISINNTTPIITVN